MHLLSLHAICGQEAVHAERFIRAFAPAVDEICLARAIGDAEPDDTIAICQLVAKELGVALRWCEYRNKTPFPHVDDFAAARNASLALTTGQVITWADFDDVITPETAVLLRKVAEDMASGKIEYRRAPEAPPVFVDENGLQAIHAFARYDLSTQGESAMRERLFTRACAPRWRGALHENLVETRTAARISLPPEVAWVHQPLENGGKDPQRNLRILRASTEMVDHYAFERGRQEFIEWNGSAEKPEEARAAAFRWLNMALADPRCLAPRRYQGLVMQAAMLRYDDPDRARDLLWQAIRHSPEQRDAYALLTEIELEGRRPTRALCTWLAGIAQKRPAPSGFQLSEKLYHWTAADLLCRARRACGEDPAPALDAQAEKAGGYRVALLHATRGRARKAMNTRAAWHEAAREPARILHIFASDEDDPDTAELEARGALVLRNSGGSCVSAWNLAAEYAASREIPVLVQLSDDWAPCMQWDHWVCEALQKASEPMPLGEKPLCLRVSDGNGESRLMCMAILTLARYRQQGHLFAPDYFGVYSDNEYTWRAEQDGVVVDGRHIHFRHHHPSLGRAAMDATYARQNAKERYQEGAKIFARRNPGAPAILV